MNKIKVGDYAKYNHTNGILGRVVDIYNHKGIIHCKIRGLYSDIIVYHIRLDDCIKLTKKEVFIELL